VKALEEELKKREDYNEQYYMKGRMNKFIKEFYPP